MTPSEATAEVFMTAFRSLRHPEQESFITRLLTLKEFREDLIDLAIAEKRKTEKARPFSKAVEALKAKSYR